MCTNKVNFENMPNMVREDFYWLIGLLEGEGSFMKEKPSHPNQPSIKIAMTDKCIIEKFNKLFDIEYIYKREYEDSTKKDCFQAQVVGKKAVEFMQKSKEYYSPRRQNQIQKALKSYNPTVKSNRGQGKPLLTDEEASEVKNLLETSDYVHSEIAEKFNVKTYVIHDIAQGRTYRGVA